MEIEIEELDAAETSALVTNPERWDTRPIHDALVRLVNTGGSIFVTGLNNNKINTLRTRMERSLIRISVRRATRGGNKGHVIMSKSMNEVEG